MRRLRAYLLLWGFAFVCIYEKEENKFQLWKSLCNCWRRPNQATTYTRARAHTTHNTLSLSLSVLRFYSTGRGAREGKRSIPLILSLSLSLLGIECWVLSAEGGEIESRHLPLTPPFLLSLPPSRILFLTHTPKAPIFTKSAWSLNPNPISPLSSLRVRAKTIFLSGSVMCDVSWDLFRPGISICSILSYFLSSSFCFQVPTYFKGQKCG